MQEWLTFPLSFLAISGRTPKQNSDEPKIQIEAQPFFIEWMQADRNRPVSQKRPIYLQL